MKHNFLMKFFSYVVLSAFLNLVFSPVLLAMGDPEHMGNTGECTRPLSISSRRSVKSSLGEEEAGFPSSQSPRVQRTEDDLLAPFLAYCQRRAEDHSGRKKIFDALSALEMGLNPDPSAFQKYGPAIGAGLIAAGASAALAELYAIDPGLGVLLGLPSNLHFFIPPTRTIVAGAFAGALTLVTAFPQMRDRLTGVTQTSSRFTSKAEGEQSLGKRAVLKGMTLGTCVILVLKNMVVFAETNTGISRTYTVFAAVAGPFFGLYKVIAVYGASKTQWARMYRWCESKIYKFRGMTRPGEVERDVVRTRLANGLRKLIEDRALGGGETEALFDDIQALHQSGKKQMIRWRTEVQTLKQQLSISRDLKEQKTLRDSIQTLEKSILALQRTLTLATVKMLHDFDREGAHFPEHLNHPKWYGDHPWWYNAARGSGYVLGGFSFYALGWSWKYVLNKIIGGDIEGHKQGDDDNIPYDPYVLPNAAVDPFATVLTVGYGAYLAEATAGTFGRIASSVMRYNPVQNERYIKTSEVTHHRVRGGTRFLNWGSQTYQELPAALLGGTGMGYAGIPLSRQWVTLAPYMVAMGAAGEVLSGDVFQSGVTLVMNRFERSRRGTDHKAQAVGDLFAASDTWVKTLRGDVMGPLVAFLGKEDLLKEEDEVGETPETQEKEDHRREEVHVLSERYESFPRVSEEDHPDLTRPLLRPFGNRRVSGIGRWIQRVQDWWRGNNRSFHEEYVLQEV